jgi:hypothetical protein
VVTNKSNLKIYLENEEWNNLKDLLKSNPRLVRHLFGYLYHNDENMRWLGVKGFGIASHILKKEKLKDLLRRMMWTLNNESGSCSWFTPQAIGEIGFNRPEIVKDFLPCLLHYTMDEDEILREGARWAVQRISESGLKIPDITNATPPKESIKDRFDN